MSILTVACLLFSSILHTTKGETVLCNSGLGACSNTTQECFVAGDCIFNCDANEGCTAATLYCLDGYDCEFFAERRRAFRDSFLHCPDNGECNMTGTSDQNYVYRNSQIYCGDNGICRFLYDAQTGLNGMQFKFISAQNSSYLYVKRTGLITITTSLQDSNIFCPSSYLYTPDGTGRTPKEPEDNCYVDCLAVSGSVVNDSNPCTWLNIYATNGFNDVYINDNTDNVNITLYCGENNEYSCNILSPNVTHCNGYNGDHPCDYISPTMYPTQIPTIQPSINPSNQPTNRPTDSPTDVPTDTTSQPTEVPTNEPTEIPTEQPTS